MTADPGTGPTTALADQTDDHSPDPTLDDGKQAGSSRLKTWKRRLETSEHANWVIFGASFLESTIVPIPLEAVLIPYLIARGDRIWQTCTMALLGCIAGALVGYFIGLGLMDTVGRDILSAMSWKESFESFLDKVRDDGFWPLVTVSLAPVPFQVGMLAAGAADYPLPLFLLATVLSRGIRYHGLGLLVRLAGDRAEKLWDRHANTIGIGLLVVVAGVIAWQFFG